MKSSKYMLCFAALVGTLFGFLSLTLGNPPQNSASYYKKDAGPYSVETVKYDWTDAARNRPVPVKIYYPKTCEQSSPVIIFSHGLGGSRDGYEYLGQQWAGYGYVSVHVEHVGSNRDILTQAGARPMEAMKKAATDIDNILNRPKDVSFAIDQLQKLNEDAASPLKGRLDLQRIGVAGHSFGAYTALASGGRKLIGPKGGVLDLSDPRIRACIAMSAPSRGKDRDCPSYEQFRIPCLHMTGTADTSPIGDTSAQDRRVPFDCISHGEEYLMIFEGGDHMVFSGRRVRGPQEKDDVFHDLIRMTTTAFWDAYLKDDPQAKHWLGDGGVESTLGKNGTFETKGLTKHGDH